MDFKELGQRRIARIPEFLTALVRAGADTMFAGDVVTGKAILRDYLRAATRFEEVNVGNESQ
jgi:hypothetical protein